MFKEWLKVFNDWDQKQWECKDNLNCLLWISFTSFLHHNVFKVFVGSECSSMRLVKYVNKCDIVALNDAASDVNLDLCHVT